MVSLPVRMLSFPHQGEPCSLVPSCEAREGLEGACPPNFAIFTLLPLNDLANLPCNSPHGSPGSIGLGKVAGHGVRPGCKRELRASKTIGL